MGIRFFDMFAGSGGFRSGLETVGGYQCIGSCEIDPYARNAYEILYDTKGERFFADARAIIPEELPDIDLICGGFPCQSFSIAGKRLGFGDDARGTLFFEIARIAAACRPAMLLLENVPGLLSHDESRTFAVILRTQDELGYDAAWQVLNSKDFGVPQARKRVYIAGFLRGKCAGQVFPDREANPAALVPAISGYQGGQGSRIYRAEGLSCTLTSNGGGFGGKTGLYGVGLPIKVKTKTGFQMAYPGDIIDVAYATANTRRGRVGHQMAHTLTTSDTQGCFAVSPYPVAVNRKDGIKGTLENAVTLNGSDWRGLNRNQTQTAVVDPNAPFRFDFQDSQGTWHQGGIRKLTPRECWRLQGFTDEQFDKVASLGLSDSRLYKMAGNTVTVPVISWLGRFLQDVWTEVAQ